MCIGEFYRNTENCVVLTTTQQFLKRTDTSFKLENAEVALLKWQKI